MSHDWTGGQYSLTRVLTGLLLLGLLAPVLIAPADAWSAALVGVLAVLAVLTIVFTSGYHARWAAALLLVGWVTLIAMQTNSQAWDSLAAAGPLLTVATLAFHIPLARAGDTPAPPYGSIDAVGRADPAGTWQYPPRLYAAVWFVLAVFYLVAGIALLRDESWRLAEALFYHDDQWATLPWVGTMPAWIGRTLTWLLLGSWLAFAPLALARRNRRLAWALPLGVSVLVLPLAGYWALPTGLAMLHLLAFNPAWLRDRKTEPTQPAATLFYDGHCGLCHRWVRFVLAEDRNGERFILSPLDSDHFRQTVSAEQRERLPDSIVIRKADGALLTQASAALYMLDRLGGLWRVTSWAVSLAPHRWLDAAYNGVARVRHRLFPKPSDACPLMPPNLRSRFRM